MEVHVIWLIKVQWKLKGRSKKEEIPLEYDALLISILKPFPEYHIIWYQGKNIKYGLDDKIGPFGV